MLTMDSVVKQKRNEKCKIVKRLGILYYIQVACYEIIQCGKTKR